ncbi:MAG: hypothetical protein DRJ47_11280 [Thermoprotei archaeon]|nr:MAG: hypothetical protein DRJ47_11280 [Thermoprotei archaeon]
MICENKKRKIMDKIKKEPKNPKISRETSQIFALAKKEKEKEKGSNLQWKRRGGLSQKSENKSGL